MMKFKIVVLFLVCLIIGSCSQEDTINENAACATIDCAPAVSFFKLKFIDKSSEADLLFNSTSNSVKYSINDVKIYSTRFKKNLTFQVDSTNKTNRFLVFSTAVTDEFVISLANLPADKLSAETQFIDQPCCDQLKITKLTLNSTSIAFEQILPTTIILKK